jgi:hypothetical protein
VAEERLGLVGAVGTAGWEKHISLLASQGPHWDGWSLRNVHDVRADLEKALGGRGWFHLFAYASKNQGGDGTIRWVATVDDARLYGSKQPFVDPAHGAEYEVYSEFRYSKTGSRDRELWV